MTELNPVCLCLTRHEGRPTTLSTCFSSICLPIAALTSCFNCLIGGRRRGGWEESWTRDTDREITSGSLTDMSHYSHRFATPAPTLTDLGRQGTSFFFPSEISWKSISTQTV